MGQQRVKEGPAEDQKEAKEDKKAQPKLSPQKQRKRLKGKDWYVILAPKMFSETQMAETPAIDPKVLVGRTVESNVSELLGQPDKYYMNLKFKITGIEGGNANTQFHGYSCAKEHLFRIIRKRSQKVRAISDIETKDGWKLHVVSLVILNRNTDIEIRRKVRKIMVSGLEESASNADIGTFIRSITSGVLQKDIRKLGNKVYPVRFSEIESIAVKKAGAIEASAAAETVTEPNSDSTDSEKVPEK
jgi:small subunit ribosomal protein S3Ae